MTTEPARAAGDFDRAVELHGGTVYAIALTRLRDRDEADEVFQEVFLAYWRRQPRLSDEGHRKAWLIKAAVNCAKKAARLKGRRERELGPAAPAQVFAFASERETDLYDALCALPEKYRSALHLHYFEDLPVAQVGRALGIGAGAVKMRLMRGREMLKEKLGGDFFEE